MAQPFDETKGRRRSIRGKLASLVFVSVGVSVGLITGVSAWRDSGREAALQTDRLKATAAVIASLSGEAADRGDRQGAYAAIRAIAALPEIQYARIETRDGKLLAETGFAARLKGDAKVGANDEASILSTLRSHSVQVTAPILYARQTVGRVVMLGKLEGTGARLTGSLLISALAALASVLLGLAIAWRLQRRISEPVLALTTAMAEVREKHDFTAQADVEADDEVKDLVDGFNAMLAEVRVRDEALAAHMASLERTVAERTADLRLARDAAESANQAKSDFLATMSHEIRTPMNGVMVMAEMLAAGEMPPRQRRFAEVIAKSGASLLAIINDILDFSKIEAGKLELESAPVDPSEVADDVASLFWEKARSKGIDLAVYAAPDVPRLIASDAVRLRQVIGNLVNNAIKFTETGGVLIEIAAPSQRRLRVAVHDTGIGIPQEKIAGLFSAFSQADQSTTRKYGGTGLGLAICKRLTEAMGGALAARSTVGKGSVFFFEIDVEVIEAAAPWPIVEGRTAEIRIQGPAARRALSRYLHAAGVTPADDGADLVVGDAARIEARDAPNMICLGEYGDDGPARLQRGGLVDVVLTQPVRRTDVARLLAVWRDDASLAQALDAGDRADEDEIVSFSGRRVLVVDDGAVNREVAMEALSRLGVEVVLANDGRAGVEAALSTGVDLVLMDGSMPEMDGYEATREIRRQEEAQGRARMPIVALTAHVVGAAAEAWRAADMDAVLHKPFTLAALARTLGQFLAPSQAPVTLPTPVETEPATAVGSHPTSDLLDEAVIGEFAAMTQAGRGDFVERVRRLYRENAPIAVQRFVEAATNQDAEEAAAAAHALKSMSLNIGARAVAELCARLESDARDRHQVAPAMAEELNRRLLATLEVLDGRAEGPPSSLTDDDRALLEDLAKAAERGEFSMVYQRQVHRDGQGALGVESLLRWRHPTRGDVSPAIFIPLAERHGLIRDITRWVLDQVMAETADLAPLTVGVNVSALEFADPDFIHDVAEQIARRRYDPTRLEIEITETAVLGDGEEVRQTIARLQEMGVKIALDDFGVGYSSLSHLRIFPFDKLKIDKTFIDDCAKDVESATLVHAVVSVGRALGMKVVAEGIETPDQQKFLKLAGVHAMQGYLFGRPEPIASLRETLAASVPPAASAI